VGGWDGFGRGLARGGGVEDFEGRGGAIRGEGNMLGSWVRALRRGNGP